MKIICLLILLKTYLASIASIFPYNYIKNSYIPIKEDIDSLLVFNNTHTILSESDGRVYSCIYSSKSKCDPIFETNSKNLLFRNEKMNQVYILNRDKGILYTLKIDTMKLINYTNLFVNDVIYGLMMKENKIILKNKNSLNLINLETFKEIKILAGYTNYVKPLFQLSNGMLVSGSFDNTLKIWNPNDDYNLVKTLSGHSNNVFSLIQLSNEMIVSGSGDIKIWDPNNDYKLVKTLTGHSEEVTSLLQLSNGMIVSASLDSTIKIWNPNDDYKLVNTLTGHKDYVYSLIQLSKKMLVSGSFDNTIKVWDPNDNYKLVKTLTGHSNFVRSLLQLSNGMLLSNSEDNTIKIWNPKDDYNLVKTLTGYTDYVWCLLQLSNGMLVSGSRDIKILNPNDDYNLVKTLTGHKGTVYSIIQLSNGMLVSGGGDIKIWNPNDDYNLVKTLSVQTNSVVSLLQLSNGMLISGSEDKTIKIWNPNVNVNKLPTKHTKDINIIKNINETYIMTVSDDRICLDNTQNRNTSDKCADLKEKVNSVTNLNNTHYLSSDDNGNLNYWDIDRLTITKSINLSELSDIKESSDSNSTVMALKLLGARSGEIIALQNTNILIINEIDQRVMYKDESICSDLKDIYVSENNFTTVCSTGEFRYYEFAPILYLNQEIFEDQINFRNALHPKDQYDKIRIQVKKIPLYLSLFRGSQKIHPESYINLNDNFGYSLNLPIDPKDDKITLSTDKDDKEYQIRIELRKPSTYSSKKINLKKGKNNIFEDAPVPKEIKTIKFKKSTYLENIFWSSDEKIFELVEQDIEYDSKLMFFFILDASVESDSTFIIKFIFKDIYDISSDILEMEIIANPSFKWYKEWYSFFGMVFAILGGLYAFYIWLKKNKHKELWESIKSGLRSSCGWLKAKLCCSFFRNDSNSLSENIINNSI